ncbi:DUF4870 domain-containing protein [Luteimonas sp. SDU101]|uniref:DUF4870 domain-containing protein n=1 Tax=Luteimonas sp. SDU101 TaxID=3422593 RepID=UPI003EBD7525
MSDTNPVHGGASQDDRTIAMLTHLSGIILGFIVPLVVWLINKDKSDRGFLISQSKEALNFQITLLFGYIIGMVLSIILIGALLNFLLWIVCIIFSVIAGLAANRGENYRYPFAIRLIN